ncbi:MAG: hypothetical protein U0166_24510 [Acidobacteriota bacterium]
MLRVLAGTDRRALAWMRAPSDRLLQAGAGREPLHAVPGGRQIAVGASSVDVPERFVETISAMAETLRAIDTLKGRRVVPGFFAQPEVRKVVDEAYQQMVAKQIVVGGAPYRVSRAGLLEEGEDGYRLRLAPEPIDGAVAAMTGARGSWDGALALYHGDEPLWKRGDPMALFPNLEKRDAARHYDAEKRLIHLGLTLDAVIPNLVEAAFIDPAAFLELALEGAPRSVVAVVAIRHETILNRQVAGEDDVWSRELCPMSIVLYADDGHPRVIHVFDGKNAEEALPP